MRTNYKILKRLLDIILSIVGISFFIPILLLISIIIRLRLGNPIFFLQERTGLNGQLFKLIKFRTMTNELDTNGNLLSDSKRVTKLGLFLREYSLDELPQFFNVLKGNMSIVGPRPLLPEYLNLYNSEQSKRHNVKPGITGWSQIKGRNSINWEEKLKFDVWYVQNKSFFLDIKIIIMTLIIVLKKKGISPKKGIFMPKFKGDKN